MGKQTIDNLKAAYAGESMARNYYSFFASVAKKEGWQEIAEIFEETARNEKEHAEVILKLLGGIKGSKENLLASIEKESYEWKDMYRNLSVLPGKRERPKLQPFLLLSSMWSSIMPNASESCLNC
ncbi:hypothetical protein N752_22595 [Desulforamulus aquiferis]|nr:hypothetical protein N752_22595 [Desulforamulus aquiferis]